MRSQTSTSRNLAILNGMTIIGFLAGLIFSVRALSSICTALMLITGRISTSAEERRSAWNRDLAGIMTASVLFYAAECLSAILHPPLAQHVHELQVRSALIFVPLACAVSFPVMQAGKMYLLRIYCILLAAAAIYCLILQSLNASPLGSPSPFLYHELVSPLGQHAVLFSLYLFFAVMILLEDLSDRSSLFPFITGIMLLLFFNVFIFLLSSKLVILLTLGYFLYKLFTSSGSVRKWKPVLAAVILSGGVMLISTNNGIHRRFRELTTGNIALLEKRSFTPADYFNAWEFRVLQFRFVPEILQEDHAWFTGTGAGRTQVLLNAKYNQTHMYSGEPGSLTKGYLEYHTHNQWLQSLLEAGLPALLAFGLLCFFLIRVAVRQRRIIYSMMTLALIAFSCTDAPFTSQYGIMLFLFFIHFLYAKQNAEA